ncbi:MAG: YgiQ family radical SAM protein [Trichloromonadaceae bacterium]
MASPCLPMTRQEMAQRGWDELDILLLTGDAYVDHPAFGVALLGRLLEEAGFRVGILAQPDWRQRESLQAMGRPRLFAAVSSGAMDSMVNHYTAAKKLRSNDAYTPGGVAGKRPNRAVIAYTAALKGAFKGLPVVIGGIEASLRRLAHYDYWDDQVRRSVLIDSKADLLIYGMGERPLLELARRLADNPVASLTGIRGTASVEAQAPTTAVHLPSFEAVVADTAAYNCAFRLAHVHSNPWSAKALAQAHGSRWVVVEPPAEPLSEAELDQVYALPFSKRPHPSCQASIPAYEQIRFSITTHRGCLGGCAFCAITHHQGKSIQSRSESSVLAEIHALTQLPEFRGTVSDVGGPTANMYGLRCTNAAARAKCRRVGCLHPQPCPHLATDDERAVRLLERIRRQPGVKHAFVASGVRYDLLALQQRYFDALLQHHVGGLLKVAPEALDPEVTRVMRKPGAALFKTFLEQFRAANRRLGLRQGVVPYFIAGHPGSSLNALVDVALFLKRERLQVEQVQEFTPTPGTLATCIYHTGQDPLTGEAVAVVKNPRELRLQKALLLWHLPEHRQDVLLALRQCGRQEVARELYPDGGPPGRSARSQRA